jgi:hypothetical protein
VGGQLRRRIEWRPALRRAPARREES